MLYVCGIGFDDDSSERNGGVVASSLTSYFNRAFYGAPFIYFSYY